MPIIRIDPPKRGRQPSTSIGKGAAEGFVTGGYLGAIAGAVRGLTEKRDPSRHNVPLEVNTDTGTVTALLQERGKHHGRDRDIARQQRAGDIVAPILEKIYRDGVMRDVPKEYRETARVVQELSYSNPYTPPEPDYSRYEGIADIKREEQPREQFEEDYSMGGFIPPGGMAGFSQMTGASRLALTRGARGRTAGTRKRRRKAKKARPAKRKRKARAAKGRKRKLVKGSAAAKRYMASIRRKRRA